jgi:hypothetical protein
LQPTSLLPFLLLWALSIYIERVIFIIAPNIRTEFVTFYTATLL